jgi:2-phospho-L-lactate guanylyltransferase
MRPDWVVLVPMKRLFLAKSRLDCPLPAHRPDVARAMVETVVATAVDVPSVRQVVVVTDEPWHHGAAPVVVVPDGGRQDLNGALSRAAEYVARRWPHSAIAAVPGDVAAVTVHELAAGLSVASAHRRSVVADHAGTGTVLLTCRSGVALDPRFGHDSLSAHVRSGAVDVTAQLDAPLLRRDLDTADDVAAVSERIPALPHLEAALCAAGWTHHRIRESVLR